MKQRLITVLALAVLLLAAVPAHATDIRVSGQFDFSFGKLFLDDPRDGKQRDFVSRQRVRTFWELIASEQLRGMLALEVGEANWGNVGENTAAGQGFSLGGDGVNIEVKHAYVDWFVPNTHLQVRMGLQPIALPSAVAGSPVLDDDMAGISLSYSFSDELAATLFWAQLEDDDDKDFFSATAGSDDDSHIFGLTLPITLDGVSITPYGLYYLKSNGTDLGDYTLWWAGTAVRINLWDPLVVKFDGIYSGLNRPGSRRDGFFLAAAVDYKLDSCTPGIFAFYSSGDRGYSQGKNSFSVISPAGFGPTSMGTDGAFGINPGAFLTDSGRFWSGVGLQVADFSFIDDLTHTARVAYFHGTDAKAYRSESSTTRDWAVEVNFDSTYAIYDNLTAVLELGYLYMNWESNPLKPSKAYEDLDHALKVALALQYTF